MPRITYKSQFGDYGINQEWENLNEYELIHILANKLSKYEDAEERDENHNRTPGIRGGRNERIHDGTS